ncbi:hypothetical protein C0J52_23611 [Blattella germanica]|nr:hypothetical protein C0J52_23611 [Blattella germanica]
MERIIVDSDQATRLSFGVKKKNKKNKKKKKKKKTLWTKMFLLLYIPCSKYILPAVSDVEEKPYRKERGKLSPIPPTQVWFQNRRAKWKKRKKTTNVFRTPGALLPSHGLPPFGSMSESICSSGMFGGADSRWGVSGMTPGLFEPSFPLGR